MLLNQALQRVLIEANLTWFVILAVFVSPFSLSSRFSSLVTFDAEFEPLSRKNENRWIITCDRRYRSGNAAHSANIPKSFTTSRWKDGVKQFLIRTLRCTLMETFSTFIGTFSWALYGLKFTGLPQSSGVRPEESAPYIHYATGSVDFQQNVWLFHWN